ncbi:hypothetical protein MNBD_GAMMA17-1207 [hydrothermal vent metagenome]|uniref:Uncharacterized protein n=1 Tax=hydrothermal vent metagenome TaxID=652676 RepID=A0A3B0Z8U7_9ZZZZ
MNIFYTTVLCGFIAAMSTHFVAADTEQQSATAFGQQLQLSSTPWHKKLMYIAAISHEEENLSGRLSDRDSNSGLYVSTFNMDTTTKSPAISLRASGNLFKNTSLHLGITSKQIDSRSSVPLAIGALPGSSSLGGGSMQLHGDGNSLGLDMSLAYQATPLMSLIFDLYLDDYDIAFVDSYSASYTSGLTISGNDQYDFSGTVSGLNITARIDNKINKTKFSSAYSFGHSRNRYTDGGIDSGNRNNIPFQDTYNDEYSEREKTHLLNASADHYFAYNFSAGIFLKVASVKVNDGYSEKSNTIAARVKYLLTQNILVVLNYEKYLKYKSGFFNEELDFDAVSLTISYNLSNKTSKRRIRKSRLMGSNRFSNVL